MIQIPLNNVSSRSYNLLVNSFGLQLSAIATGIKDLPTKVAASLANVQPTPSTASASSSSSISPARVELPPQLDRSEYPNVIFWDSDKWKEVKKKGKTTDEDGVEPNDLDPGTSITSCFMEDANGKQQPEATKEAARATARSFWIKLWRANMAPEKFSDLDIDLKNEYISLMEKEFPWLRYCENHWKAKRIWQGHYSQWYGPMMKREAAKRAKEVVEKAAAEGRVINVDADDDSGRDGQEKSAKRPRDDNEPIGKSKRRRVANVESTPPNHPTPSKVTTTRLRVCFFALFGYVIY